jgi:hypothetical protein
MAMRDGNRPFRAPSSRIGLKNQANFIEFCSDLRHFPHRARVRPVRYGAQP